MSGQPEELETTVDVAIGRAVVRLRTSAGWTQQELADRMRTRGWPWTQPAVAKVELGKRPVRLAEAKDLAQFLGVKTQDLLVAPLDDAIDSLRSREAEAMKTAAKAEREIHRCREGYETLDEIRRADAGERVYFGPEPWAGVINAFRQLSWDETSAILRQLGASEAEVTRLNRYRLKDPAKEKSRRPNQFIDYFTSLVLELVPNLHTDPE